MIKKVIIVVSIIAALSLLGAFLWRHFVTDRIMDKDGMINEWQDVASADDLSFDGSKPAASPEIQITDTDAHNDL